MKACVLVMVTAVLSGCAVPAASWKGQVEWPDEHSAKLVVSPMEAGAALAAAGAIREMVRTNPHPRLFRGCSSPEQGLDVVVFTGPTSGLYYVVIHPRFDRCGGPVGRVLDGWDAYAVTPQGEVVAKAPPPAAEQTPTPVAPPPSPGAETSIPTPPPVLAPAVSPPAETPPVSEPVSQGDQPPDVLDQPRAQEPKGQGGDHLSPSALDEGEVGPGERAE